MAYGEHSDQFAELSLPAGEPSGVVALVHGGFWKPEYGLEYARPLVPSLLARGWATWTIEYRRGTGAADTLADVLAAIRACPVPARRRVGVGHSAGGHLVTWAVGRLAGSADRSATGLTRVISQAGVLDLRAAYADGLGDDAVERFLGRPPAAADPDGDLDPIRQVPLPVPVLCVHATGDDVVPIAQSRDYVAAARAAGGRADLLEVEGGHFTVVDPDSAAWAATLAQLDPAES